ncbi:MAG: methyltransferase domain-containing protein, partial [bacterium]|nr:methyltransferase domain-containing protein [bacterium]
MTKLLFRQRSEEKELLDLGPEFYSLQEYQQCQKILFKINKLLGVFSHTKRFLKHYSSKISVLDVGCGGGLFVLNLSRYFPEVQFTGCDISKDAIEMAKEEAKDYPNT